MSDRPRYVVDTNVIVSALLIGGSAPGRAVRRVLEVGELILSTQAATELQEVLSRPKFTRYVTAEEREAFLSALIARALLVEPTETIRVCRDPKDDMLLELAVAGGATAILSGDADLLVLGSFRSIAILSPGDFLRSQDTP
jgi:putative PIN family toxin of toxin-antitoxin system